MKYIKAKYKGLDGSLGYKTGVEYILELHDISMIPRISNVGIKRLDNNGVCIYSTFAKFMENWENVSEHVEKVKQTEKDKQTEDIMMLMFGLIGAAKSLTDKEVANFTYNLKKYLNTIL